MHESRGLGDVYKRQDECVDRQHVHGDQDLAGLRGDRWNRFESEVVGSRICIGTRDQHDPGVDGLTAHR